jgi:hypothetical protein
MQAACLCQERISVIRLTMATKPDAESEIGISERHIRRDDGQVLSGLVRIEGVPPCANPIPDRIEISAAGGGAGGLVVS